MNKVQGTSWLFAIWALTVILIGSVLTSYHQPFQTPDDSILALVAKPLHPQWRALHVLSASCGCSQRVMQHLLQRRLFDGVAEEILIVDGDAPDLPGSSTLLASLERAGFSITHIAAKDLPQNTGLHGVPLLVFASPTNHIAYIGGYGSTQDRDAAILEQIRSGQTAKPLAVLGCAIGKGIRRQADPLHLKY